MGSYRATSKAKRWQLYRSRILSRELYEKRRFPPTQRSLIIDATVSSRHI